MAGNDRPALGGFLVRPQVRLLSRVREPRGSVSRCEGCKLDLRAIPGRRGSRAAVAGTCSVQPSLSPRRSPAPRVTKMRLRARRPRTCLFPASKVVCPATASSGTTQDNCSQCHLYHDKSVERDRDRRPLEELLGRLRARSGSESARLGTRPIRAAALPARFSYGLTRPRTSAPSSL